MFSYSASLLTAAAVAAPQDTTGQVAYVTKRTGPPDTASYMYAGYLVGIGCYLGYIVLMLRRIAHSKRRLDALSSGGGNRR